MPGFQPPDNNALARFMQFLGSDIRTPFTVEERQQATGVNPLDLQAFSTPAPPASSGGGGGDISSIINGIGEIFNSTRPVASTPTQSQPQQQTQQQGGGGGGQPPIVWTNPQGQVIDPVTGRPPGIGARPPITWGMG